MGKWCYRSGLLGRCPVVVAVLAAVGMPWSAAMAQQDAGKPEVPAAESPTRTTDFEPPAADAVAEDAPDPDAPSILIGAFLIRYQVEHPQYPALDDLMKASVTLGRSDLGFVRPGGGVPTATYTLEELSSQPAQRYTWGAAEMVARAVRDELNRQGIVGVQVVTDDIVDEEQDGQRVYTDVRPRGQTALTLKISSAIVSEVRSVAFGEAVPFEARLNNPRYQRIVDNSPVQVFDPDDQGRYDLLRKDLLDDYVYRLNRHPGRRVDLGIAAADADNSLILDYYVNENRPWLIYGQISNTGTKQTNEWRERVGFVHNQLTNDDDILTLDYVTAGFDASHAFSASYERPVWDDWLRAKVYGSWSEFTASDVGAVSQEFSGDSYAFGLELIANVYQHKDWFFDVYGGVRWQNIGIESSIGSTQTNDASENFFLPALGARVEHSTDKESTLIDVGIEMNIPEAADADENKISTSFQRTNADARWTALQWDASHSFYLEPLLIPTRWRNMDINDPEASPTLAHELAVSFRGQYAFDSRLIPNFQQVAGGLYTVRGYPESVSAGDSIVIGTLEYRFHLPQALGFSDTPGTLFGQTFRYKPQTAYGRADWDLILKAFVDAAKTFNSESISGENDDTLIGAGVGAEFLFRRNLSVRVDWGIALEEIENEVSSGSNRFHISVTILF
jgi:hemolysin activation/secretion protein